MTYRVRLWRWGQAAYREGWERQEDLAAQVRAGGDDALVFVEHPPVYTFGRRVQAEHLLVPAGELSQRGAEVVESDRGGDITFHGPGQIVCYPIIGLRRRGLGPSEYVRGLEETVIRALDCFGIVAGRSPGRPGVWVGNNKIAAIGVRVRGGVTTHGFAVNVSTDLNWFAAIVPCGLFGAGVTSMEHEVGGGHITIPDVQNALADSFEGVFDSELIVQPFTHAGGLEVALSHGH